MFIPTCGRDAGGQVRGAMVTYGIAVVSANAGGTGSGQSPPWCCWRWGIAAAEMVIGVIAPKGRCQAAVKPVPVVIVTEVAADPVMNSPAGMPVPVTSVRYQAGLGLRDCQRAELAPMRGAGSRRPARVAAGRSR